MKITRFEDLQCLAPLDNFYFVYVLRSEKDNNFYTGYSENLHKRIEKHDTGRVESTIYRGPFKLVYYEACLNKKDALKRERYLKTAWGKRYIKSRLSNWLRPI